MNKKVILVALATVSFAIAQPPQGKRGQRGQRERTAPGGISWAAYGFNGLGIVRLLEVPEVQAELKFTSEDKAALPLLRDEFSEEDSKYRMALTEAAGKSRDAFLDSLAIRSKEIDKQMTEILGERFKRFQEIRRQAFGVMASATSDAVVRDALAITGDQRSKFNAERQKLVDSMRDRTGQGKKAVESNLIDEGMRDFAAQEEKLFISLLTDSQAAKWKELVGSPMEIPQEVVRFVRRARYEPAAEGDRPAGRSTKGSKRGFRKKDMGGKQPPVGEGEKKPPL